MATSVMYTICALKWKPKAEKPKGSGHCPLVDSYELNSLRHKIVNQGATICFNLTPNKKCWKRQNLNKTKQRPHRIKIQASEPCIKPSRSGSGRLEDLPRAPGREPEARRASGPRTQLQTAADTYALCLSPRETWVGRWRLRPYL